MVLDNDFYRDKNKILKNEVLNIDLLMYYNYSLLYYLKMMDL